MEGRGAGFDLGGMKALRVGEGGEEGRGCESGREEGRVGGSAKRGILIVSLV